MAMHLRVNSPIRFQPDPLCVYSKINIHNQQRCSLETPTHPARQIKKTNISVQEKKEEVPHQQLASVWMSWDSVCILDIRLRVCTKI